MTPDPLPPRSSPRHGDVQPSRGSPPQPPAAEFPGKAPPAFRRSWVRRVWQPVPGVLILGALAALWWQQAAVLDWWYMRSYQPAATIRQLADQTAMSDYGRRLFYVNRPAIEDKTAFNAHCPNASAEIAVLGCYRGDRQGIYIYRVTDERLHGIHQVTAAHEMLHQAYDRLSDGDRTQLDGLLHTYAATITDQTLLDKLEAYRQRDASHVPNEMHSIFGTEVASLPPQLEMHYKQFFTNRQQVVTYHAAYRQAFIQREEQIKAYDAQLEGLKKEIETGKAQLDSAEASLNAERARLEAWLDADEVARYNAAVPGFNAKINAYRSQVAAVNERIATYNDIVEKRNALSVEEQDLLKAQDSHAPAAQTP